MQPERKLPSLTGLLVTSVILILWLGSWTLALATDIGQMAPSIVVATMVGRTFIQTGLFIVAHDAIHGSVVPGAHRLNRAIGQLALILYALLPYQKLAHHHSQHHRQPGRTGDPDFHDGIHDSIFAWYLKFMIEYLDRRQQVVLFFGMKAIFFSLYLGFHVHIPNLFLFWVLPIVFSSIQLFFFGTYLPHRVPDGSTQWQDPKNPHHATSRNYHPILSFLTCYHFGYHWEHHEYPFLPWYRLPSVRQPISWQQSSSVHPSEIGHHQQIVSSGSPN